MKTGFYFGKASSVIQEELADDLALTNKIAIEKYSKIDYANISGIRTLEQQKAIVSSGASKSVKSRHLAAVSKNKAKFPIPGSRQSLGQPVSHAVDVIAFVDGKRTFEHKHMLEIAEGMRKACQETKVPIVWGGSWVLLNNIKSFEDLVDSIEEYKKRIAERNKRTGLKSKALIDTGHFELYKSDYPIEE